MRSIWRSPYQISTVFAQECTGSSSPIVKGFVGLCQRFRIEDLHCSRPVEVFPGDTSPFHSSHWHHLAIWPCLLPHRHSPPCHRHDHHSSGDEEFAILVAGQRFLGCGECDFETATREPATRRDQCTPKRPCHPQSCHEFGKGLGQRPFHIVVLYVER